MERLRACLAGSVFISRKGSSMSFAHDGLRDGLTFDLEIAAISATLVSREKVLDLPNFTRVKSDYFPANFRHFSIPSLVTFNSSIDAFTLSI